MTRLLRALFLSVLFKGILIDSIPHRSRNPTKYKSNEEVEEYLLNLTSFFPDRIYTFSIGNSAEGRKLNAVAIAARDPGRHIPLRPDVLFTANIHGNEVVGREVLLRLIPYLMQRYGENSMITSLLDNTRLIIIPSLNPDGFERAREGDCSSVIGRGNRNGIDLNRNYPKVWRKHLSDDPEPETRAMIEFTKTMPVALFMDFHGGTLVVNYPFDSRDDSLDLYSAAPDDDVFRKLAKDYSKNSEKMSSMGDTWCPLDPDIFKDGITNGAHWYSTEGCLQDFMYVYRGAMAFTLEISCCKYPQSDTLESFWTDSVIPVLNFWKGATQGIKGMVFEEGTQKSVKAKLKIVGRDISFYTGDDGDYYRILLPGKYRIIAEADNYMPTIEDFELTEHTPQLTLNLTMQGQKSRSPGA